MEMTYSVPMKMAFAVLWLSNSEGEDNAKDGVVQGVSGEAVR